MFYLLNKLLIVFLYINVLAPTLEAGTLRVGKIVFALLFAVYAAQLATNRSRISSRFLFYLVGSFFGMGILSCVGLLLGNDCQIVFGLFSMIFIILIVPPLASVARTHGMEPYINHLIYAIISLGFAQVILFLLCGPLGLRQVGEFLSTSTNPLASAMSFAFFPGGVRVGLTNAGFLPPGLILLYFRFVSSGHAIDFLGFLIVGIAISVTYTMSLWVSAAVGIVTLAIVIRPGNKTSAKLPSAVQSARTRFFPMMARKWRRRKFLVGLILLAGGGYFLSRIPLFILDSKRESIDFKGFQFNEAIASFFDSPLLGNGLGYIYSSSKFRGITGEAGFLFENSYVTILSSTGLLGLLIFTFIYGYYPLSYLVGRKKNSMGTVILVAYGVVLVQSIGNPYLWSGGLGMFFACLLGAHMEGRTKIVPQHVSQAHTPRARQ